MGTTEESDLCRAARRLGSGQNPLGNFGTSYDAASPILLVAGLAARHGIAPGGLAMVERVVGFPHAFLYRHP